MIEHFKIRTEGSEWAEICIDNDTGLFMAHSSFGNFGFTWCDIGEQSLKEFFSECEQDYFMDKVTNYQYWVFSGRQTLLTIKKDLIEKRKCRRIKSKKLARELWDTLDYLDTNASYALGFYYESPELLNFYDRMPPSKWERNIQCVGFWEQIWPVFLKEIKN